MRALLAIVVGTALLAAPTALADLNDLVPDVGPDQIGNLGSPDMSCALGAAQASLAVWVQGYVGSVVAMVEHCASRILEGGCFAPVEPARELGALLLP